MLEIMKSDERGGDVRARNVLVVIKWVLPISDIPESDPQQLHKDQQEIVASQHLPYSSYNTKSRQNLTGLNNIRFNEWLSPLV